MSSSSPSAKPSGVCPQCGAAIDGPGVCWLCHTQVDRPVEAPTQPAQPEQVASPFAAAQDQKPILMWSTMATFGMIGLIGMGTSLYDQWVGIAYWLVVAPASW